MVIRFKIGGSLRFLSHAETLRLFERACVRAGLNLQYSQGFNPHPRFSLPLPRPVGVESDDELLTIRVYRDASRVMSDAKGYPNLQDGEYQDNVIRDTQYAIRNTIKDSLSSQLPQGCELISVSTARAGASFGPCSATYIFAVKREFLDSTLESRIEDLLSSDNLVVRRMTDKKKSKFKNIDVRGFIKTIELDKAEVNVRCIITPAGSIRVREVLELMELDMERLASPIRRTCVQWRDV